MRPTGPLVFHRQPTMHRVLDDQLLLVQIVASCGTEAEWLMIEVEIVVQIVRIETIVV